MSYFQELKQSLADGINYGVEEQWYTLNSPEKGMRTICIWRGDVQEFRDYKNISTYAKAVKRLLNVGI